MLRSPSVPTRLHWGCEWLQLAVQKLKSKPVLFHTWAWQNSASITSYFLGARVWQFKLQHTDEICVVGKKHFDALEGVLPSARTKCIKMAGLEFWISSKCRCVCVCMWALKISVSHCFTIDHGSFSHSWNKTFLLLQTPECLLPASLWWYFLCAATETRCLNNGSSGIHWLGCSSHTST